MKIAMMVRGYIPAPRPSDIIYAPIDLAVSLAQELTARGHEVTYFGPQGTHIPGVQVETLNLRPLVHNQKEFAELIRSSDKLMHYVPGLWDRKFSNEMFARARNGEFDLLYFHHPEIALSSAQVYTDVPVAYTLNDPIYDWYRELFDLFKSPNQYFVSISNNQQREGPDLNFIDTIYNGIDTTKYKFGNKHEDYLLFAGRIIPEKGIKEAVQIAQATKHRLFIIGPVYDDHKEYFDQYIKPHLNDKILYLGFMEQEQLIKYYQKAKAFLFPLQWEEPFGLVMTEAMACGTPVIALKRGAAPEIIADGKTGFLCDHIQDMIEAVDRVDGINRRDCRKHVEQNFAIKNMVDGYEKAFEQIIRQHRGAQAVTPQTIGKKLKRLPKKLRSHITGKPRGR